MPEVAMLVGYARVSTQDQELSLQRDALRAAGCERIFEDVARGVLVERPDLTRYLDSLREGDILVVWKLDRLGRSLKHLVDTVTCAVTSRESPRSGSPLVLLEQAAEAISTLDLGVHDDHGLGRRRTRVEVIQPAALLAQRQGQPREML